MARVIPKCHPDKKHVAKGLCTACYCKADPKYVEKYTRKNLLRTLRGLGISEDDYYVMLERQGGRCAICDGEPNGNRSRLHVDHDHLTNEFRGLLCTNCNPGLGYFKDRPDLLRAAADYLERRS